MKIEVLFPEICNLYGDLGNIMYLERACENLQVTETSLKDEPLFMTETPDLIYMGTTTERGQELIIEKLSAYKDKIGELIDEGARFLLTGNALEIFGREITDKDGTVVKGLNVFPISTKRDMMKRFNSLYLGKFEDMNIVGYKSQFTHSWYDEEVGHLFDTIRGPGLNPDTMNEGIRVNNFMATYVIGPLLVLNPPFTKWLLEQMGEDSPKLAFEDAAMDAYDVRVKEYSNPSTGFYY